MITRPRTQYMLVILLATLIFSGLANAQDAQSATCAVRGAVATAGPDGVSDHRPGVSMTLKQGTAIAETSAKDAGEYESVGGAAFLLELSQEVATAAHAEYYARIVRDTAVLRSLIHARAVPISVPKLET